MKRKRAKKKQASSKPQNRVASVPRARAGAYIAAEMDRLTEDWAPRILSSHASLGYRLRTMRARARMLEQDDRYTQGFLRALRRNVVGAHGMKLEMDARTPRDKADKKVNDAVESAWAEWCKVCDASRQQCWPDFIGMILGRVAVDGEILVEDYSDPDNGFGFSLNACEADHLDELLDERKAGGITVRMGVEINAVSRPIAYHLWHNHPGDLLMTTRGGFGDRRRVEASKIIHPFLKARPAQVRGVPWFHAVMRDLKMLDGYREAELTAARVSSAKAGFFKHDTPDGWQGEQAEDGTLRMEVEPGMFEDLPMGTDFVPWDPTHPNGNFDGFNKAVLRGIGAGLGASYATLSGDLEGVNYSSIRAGLLDERDEWTRLQRWVAEHICQPIFAKWLRLAIMSGRVSVPLTDYDRLVRSTIWNGRKWQWVDPEKDLKAAVLAVENGFRSRREIVREVYGQEIEDVFEDLASEKELAEDLGITLGAPEQPQPMEQEDSAEDDAEDEMEDGESESEDGMSTGDGDEDSKKPKIATEDSLSAKPKQPAASAVAQDVQKQALNGAQLAALQEMLSQVSSGQLSPEAAKQALYIALPNTDPSMISAMIDEAAAFTPEPVVEPVLQKTDAESKTDAA